MKEKSVRVESPSFAFSPLRIISMELSALFVFVRLRLSVVHCDYAPFARGVGGRNKTFASTASNSNYYPSVRPDWLPFHCDTHADHFAAVPKLATCSCLLHEMSKAAREGRPTFFFFVLVLCSTLFLASSLLFCSATQLRQVNTILSQNTTDTNSRRAFLALKQR